LIVFAMIRSTAALSLSDILALVHAALTPSATRRRGSGLVAFGKRPYLPNMTPDLTDEETAAPVRLLSDTINNDRYQLSPRIQTFEGHPRQAQAGAGVRAPAADTTRRQPRGGIGGAVSALAR
jgi:hypothetical protein